MIKHIFLPEKVGNSLLFSKKIVGIDMQKTILYATIIEAKGTTQTIKQYFEIPVEQQTDQHIQDPKTEALLALKKMVGSCLFYTLVPSSLVVYKELLFPFAEREKIALVIQYEIEPLLPFAAQDAIIDFMITKVDALSGKATVLAACIQKHHLAEHLAPFIAAGITLDLVTIDLFALYGLYTQLYQKTIAETRVLLELGMHTTKIAYIQEGSLSMIRVLPQGMGQVFKATGEHSSSAHELFQTMIRYGVESSDVSLSIERFKKLFLSLLDTVQFTIGSYGSKQLSKLPSEIIIFGTGARIPGIERIIESHLHVPTHHFSLTSTPTLINEPSTIPLDGLYSVATAFTASCNEEVNVLKDNFAQKNSALFIKQLCTAALLTCMLMSMLLGLHITQVRKLKRELATSTQEVVEALKTQFSKIPKDTTNLDEIIDLAQQEIHTEKELWFAFSYANQSKFLHYLLELTYKIDKEGLGFEPERITIAEGILTLKAKVRDYEALKVLERELKSSTLFSTIPPQDNPQFTMQIGLAPTNQES